MPIVGYLPYRASDHCAEAGWLSAHLGVEVRVADGLPALNDWPRCPLPSFVDIREAVRELVTLPAVVAEGPAGFLWAAVLRTTGFTGQVTILPYLNPRRWYDVGATAVYRRFADPRDRIYLGSTPSAAVYRACGVDARVGEPYGIDDLLFAPRVPGEPREALGIPPGRLLLFAGRAHPDKDLNRLLLVGLKARLLFRDLQIVIASHVVDPAYLSDVRGRLNGEQGVHFLLDPAPGQLADLYNQADVFVTAATSHFETFGRALAEALACGSPVVAPRYDGFTEILAQPGGTLVDVAIDAPTGAPVVDEDKLLRAVYDVLSTPHPPCRTEVAALARNRFGRSRTIRLLDHLVTKPAALSHNGIAPAAVELPGAWRTALATIARGAPAEALSWFLHNCDHYGLAAEDEAFAVQVRWALCGPAADTGRR